MLNESYQQLWEEAKKYLQLRFDLLRVELLEKLALICGLLLTVIVSLIIGIILFTYLSILLLLWLKTLVGLIPALLIIAGIHAILLILVIVCRKTWFLNPLIRSFSKILFSGDNTTPKQEEEQV